MTRTVLNWSELLDQYRGRCIISQERLKKWAEMENPATAKNRYKRRSKICNPNELQTSITFTNKNTVIIEQDDSKISTTTQENPISTEPKSTYERVINDPHDKTFKIVERQTAPESISMPTQPQPSKVENRPIKENSESITSLQEMLADVIMQDTESIPELLNTDKSNLQKSSRFSEHDNLLIDMLELNLRDNE